MSMTASGMFAKIKAARAAAVQTSDEGAAKAYSDAMLLAFCQGIVAEIVANAELVPVSTDSGPAGAGIITGKVS